MQQYCVYLIIYNYSFGELYYKHNFITHVLFNQICLFLFNLLNKIMSTLNQLDSEGKLEEIQHIVQYAA